MFAESDRKFVALRLSHELFLIIFMYAGEAKLVSEKFFSYMRCEIEILIGYSMSKLVRICGNIYQNMLKTIKIS